LGNAQTYYQLWRCASLHLIMRYKQQNLEAYVSESLGENERRSFGSTNKQQ